MNKDAQLIAEAYEQVLEGNFGKALKSLGAAAALATTGYAADPDTVNPHEKGATITQEHPKVIDHAAETLPAEYYNRQIIFNKIPYNDPKAVEAIAKDPEVAKDYIHSRMLLGQEIPASLVKTFPDIVKTLKSYFKNAGV